jgi:uncharacterized membrane protein (UPF0127 family)
MSFVTMHTASGATLGDRIQLANTSVSRGVGLLRHTHLAPGEGLWIRPSSGVHMFGMKFAIDVVGLDKKMRVVRLWPNLKPWRMTALVWSMSSAIELPVGVIAASGLKLGDTISFAPRQDSAAVMASAAPVAAQ